MKLFGYYAWHSFVNQLRKLFKTWVLIFFLVCMLMGGIIGFGAATLEDVSDSRNPEESVTEEMIDAAQEEESLQEPLSEEEMMGIIELIAGGAILAVFLFEVISADKNGSKIFLPADVNLLFASPMKPQSVLMFRLMTQLGMMLLSSVYLAFQLPNLVINVGISVWAAIGVLMTWLLAIVVGKLLQVFFYTIASTYTGVKQYLRRGVYAFIALLAGIYVIYVSISGLEYLEAAQALFNQGITRWIPLWGWLKGFCMYALEGNGVGAMLSLAALVAGSAVLTVFIWRIQADFYEDAMAKSEETAQLLEVAQAEKSTGFVKRKKDRSEKLRRDGMKQGSGANVFFFRVMYNRFRFAHLGIFTKTSETYLTAAAGVCILCKFILEAEGVIPVILTLSVLVFFRSMGNPLAEDTGKDFFRMIPESTGKKLFWSVMGGTATCLMDLLPALILPMIFFMENPLVILAWVPFILSIDFYGTNVGAFIDLSVPVAAGKTIKQVVQIMFIYFGLLPDIAMIAVGFVFDQLALGALGCALVNFGLGGLFLALTPLFLEHKEKPVRREAVRTPEELAQAKKDFSLLGLGGFVIILVSAVLQFVCVEVLPDMGGHSWAMWVYTFAPIYLAAVPLGVLVCRRVRPILPKSGEAAGARFTALQWVKIVLICAFMMYGGNLLGNLITMLIGSLKGSTPQAGIMEYIGADSIVFKILFIVILAPVIEEFVFRKVLIDRMRGYGEGLAVFTSALMFGLFHGNLTQLFYAFGIGLVFGYVYLKTTKLRYSIGLHMGINFLGSIVSSALLEAVNAGLAGSAESAAPSLSVILFAVYVISMILAAVVGLVVLCRSVRLIHFEAAPLELPRRGKLKTAYINRGMLLFAAACAAMIVLSLM